MRTCGECAYLVQNKAGAYICAGRLSTCVDQPTPKSDASHCIKFDRKEPPKAAGK